MSLNKRYGITIMIVLRPCIYLLDLGPVSQMTDVAHRSYILSHLKMYCIRNSPSMLRKCYDQYVYTCVSVKAKMLYGFYGFILFSLFFFSKKRYITWQDDSKIWTIEIYFWHGIQCIHFLQYPVSRLRKDKLWKTVILFHSFC